MLNQRQRGYDELVSGGGTPKIGVLVNFSRFQAAVQILTVNCAEMVQDKPGQPAHEMFGIERRLQRCKVRPPRFNESSV